MGERIGATANVLRAKQVGQVSEGHAGWHVVLSPASVSA